MTRRPTQDDLTQRVDELQARLAAIEENQASGASGAPERTTRRDMFRRAGITAAGVVGGAVGVSLLNAQTVHAATGTGTGQAVDLGEDNFCDRETFVANENFGSGSQQGFGSFGRSTGLLGFGSQARFSGTGANPNSIGVFGSGSGTGLSGFGNHYGTWASGGRAGVFGRSTGSGGVIGTGTNTGVLGLGTGISGATGRGVAGSGITGVLGNAGAGNGVRGVVTGAGIGVFGSGTGSTGTGGLGTSTGVQGVGSFLGIRGVGFGPTGSGGTAPDFFAANSGRLVQASNASPPAFPSFSAGSEEQVRSDDGLLWLSDGQGGWMPATVGGWGISLFSAMITTQPTLSNSDGATWQAIDPGLVLTITPTFNCDALLKLTGAPWSSTDGFNQDIGIVVGTSAYTASTNDPNGWTESGGFNTYSPNGAATEALVGLTAGTTYTITAVWKANKGGTSKLFMGAGPLTSGSFSPTRLTAHLLTDSAAGAAAVTKNRPAPKRVKRVSRVNSRIKAGKAHTPAKRSAPKKAAARKAKLTHQRPATRRSRGARNNKS